MGDLSDSPQKFPTPQRIQRSIDRSSRDPEDNELHPEKIDVSFILGYCKRPIFRGKIAVRFSFFLFQEGDQLIVH